MHVCAIRSTLYNVIILYYINMCNYLYIYIHVSCTPLVYPTSGLTCLAGMWPRWPFLGEVMWLNAGWTMVDCAEGGFLDHFTLVSSHSCPKPTRLLFLKHGTTKAWIRTSSCSKGLQRLVSFVDFWESFQFVFIGYPEWVVVSCVKSWRLTY